MQIKKKTITVISRSKQEFNERGILIKKVDLFWLIDRHGIKKNLHDH